MTRALDHIVLPSADLAAAAAAMVAAGFLVSGRNRHPWGTENHVVQLPGAFLELIAPAADYRPLPSEHDAFPFAGPVAGQGPASTGMLVWRSADAVADARALEAMGLGTGRRLDFRRENRGPDGVSRPVAFSLAFADAPALGGLGVFTCQHHHPGNFWAPGLQRHPNGAAGVQAVRIQAPDAGFAAATLARLAGSRVEAGPDGPVVPLAEGARIEVVPGAACRLAGVVLRGTENRLLPALGDVALALAR